MYELLPPMLGPVMSIACPLYQFNLVSHVSQPGDSRPYLKMAVVGYVLLRQRDRHHRVPTCDDVKARRLPCVHCSGAAVSIAWETHCRASTYPRLA